MGKAMQYLFWASVSTVLITSINSDNGPLRFKRGNAETFDILLNIYKMNPLKQSNIFKTFSNTILLPRPDGRTPDLNFDSNESTKEKRIRMRAKFKQIEDAIHVTLSKTIAKRPSLNIQEKLTDFKDIRPKEIPTNFDDENFLEFKKDYANGKKKVIEHASENKNKSGDLNVIKNETHKPVVDNNVIGFDKNTKNNEIGFDNNGIAVVK